MGQSFERESLAEVMVEQMHTRALATMNASKINMEDFVEPYGVETLERDLANVASKKEKFAERSSVHEEGNKMIADIFEAIILEHGELSDWFGPNATTIKTSDFDDFENGVDTVIEFRNPEAKGASYLGLAADVTFSADTTRKFDRIRSHIEKGELGRVKYFHSEYMNIHGQLSKLPEVVIGADKKTVMQLAELWAEHQNGALASHPIQLMILRQMRGQLEAFSMYAAEIGNAEASSLYAERLEIIDEILASKTDLETKLKYDMPDDSVHLSIMDFVSRWKKAMMAAR